MFRFIYFLFILLYFAYVSDVLEPVTTGIYNSSTSYLVTQFEKNNIQVSYTAFTNDEFLINNAYLGH